MTNNLWEIIKFDDLVYLLRNAEKKFVVLSIITEDTDESIKKMIKVFVKEKSKIYPKVTFLFYKAKKQDFGRLQPMFDKDIEKYPKLFHIWDVKEIKTGVIAIDNKEILEKSFEDFQDVYKEGTMPNFTEENSEKDFKEEEEEEEENINQNKKNNINQNFNQNQNQNLNKNLKQQIPPQIQPVIQQYKDPAMEKKKFIEKIQLLRKKQEESTLDFLNEFKKRKEEEEEVESGSGKRKKNKNKQK